MPTVLKFYWIIDSSNDMVKIVKITGPKQIELPSGEGFYVCSRIPLDSLKESKLLILQLPEKGTRFILEENMQLLASDFERKMSFISKIQHRLFEQKRKKKRAVRIEIEKPPTEKPAKQKGKRKNTGIQITIANRSGFSTVTHLQALLYNELPSKYLASNLPKVWQDENKLFAEPDLVLFEVGCAYRPYYIQSALQHTRLAGEHLAMVNKVNNTNWKTLKNARFKDGKLIASSSE